MKLTKEEARDIISDDHEDWTTQEIECVDQTRWDLHYQGVFLHGPTQKYYRMYWSTGATEIQDTSPFEYDEPEPFEVRPVERLVTLYEAVK